MVLGLQVVSCGWSRVLACGLGGGGACGCAGVRGLPPLWGGWPPRPGMVIQLFGWRWCGWTLVPVVTAGTPLEVDAKRRDPFGKSVGCDADLPVGVVRGVVMRGADQQQIGQTRGTTISPMVQMMHVTPFRRDITRRKGAATVTKDHRTAQRSGNSAGGPANIQRLPVTTEHHRDDLRV